MRSEPEDSWLIGRRVEVDAVLAAVRSVAGGRGGAVLIEGEPGIGKSALLQFCFAQAQAAGCRIFDAAADPLTARFALQVLVEAVDIPGGLKADAADEPSPSGDATVIRAEQILAWIDRLCVTAPIVVAIEDLQWADTATLKVWSRLVAACGQLGLLLVATARSVPPRPELAQLRQGVADQGGSVLELAPLDNDDAADLAGRLAGGVAGPELRNAVAAAGGNPLYIREIIGALIRSAGITVTGGQAELSSSFTARPVSLDGAIADRLDFVTGPTRDVLRHASLLGPQLLVTELAALTELTACQLMAPIGESLTAGVLATDGDRLTFRHSLIRDSLYESMPQALRTALHLQAASALAAVGAPCERVAAQLLPASEEPDEWAVGWLVDHGSQLAVRSPAAAVELLSRVLASALPSGARREELNYFLAMAAAQAGDHELVERVGHRLLARATNRDRAAAVTCLLSDDLLSTGRFDDALELVGQPAADDKAQVRSQRAIILQHIGRYDDARVEAESALGVARSEPDGLAATYALHALSIAAWIANDASRAVALIDEALEVVGEDPSAANLRIVLWVNRANWSATVDEVEAALHGARSLTVYAGRRQDRSLASAEASFYYRSGRWDDAIAVTESEAMVTDQSASRRVRRHGIAALTAARRDHRDDAARHLAAVNGLSLTGMVRAQSLWLLLAQVAVAERAGDPDAALDLLRPTVGDGEADLHPGRWQWLPTMIRLARAVADEALVETVVEVARRDAVEPSMSNQQVAARWCVALAQADADTLDSCAEHFRAAGWLPLVAEIEVEAAAVRAAGGDLSGARSRLDSAVAIYSGLGAVWEASRADARLFALGVRRRRSVRPGRATSGWGSLTTAELRIADLVAEGLSNPDIAATLFISRRTVETHIAHILTKLGVRSRVDVAIEADRQKPR